MWNATTTLHNLIFPQLADAIWEPINLDSMAAMHHEFHPETNFLDPVQMDDFITQMHKALGCDYTYGGYMEDRSFLWSGSYILEGKALHLGVDFNVPYGTIVHSPVDGEVEEILEDNHEVHGWGNRIKIRTHINQKGGGVNVVHLILAHLAPTIFPKVGDRIQQGEALGWVGMPEQNGGWFEHLHVQLNFTSDEKYDGYAAWSKDLEYNFPDPNLLVQSPNDN